MTSIRIETSDDYDAIRRVIVDAFTACEHGYNGEAELVDQLRNECDDLLGLVATDDDTIVGHILFSRVAVRVGGNLVHGMGLAPMSVQPERQQTGIGTALVESGLEQLAARVCPFVVVLGHPDYYPRFHFRPAKEYDLSHGFADIPQDVFFARILDQNFAQSFANSTAVYRPEFGPQESEYR